MASPTYRITYKGSVAKELRKIDRQTQKRLLAAIEGLATNPRPDGVKKLKSKYDQYRIRVGNYRIVYEIADGQLHVLVLRVAHRKKMFISDNPPKGVSRARRGLCYGFINFGALRPRGC